MEGRDITTNNAPKHHETSTNKSLQKALQLLACFTEERSEWSVSELSRHLGIGKSTVSTMLSTLASADLVHQSPSTRRYQLGLRCLEMGYLTSSRLVLRDLAFPYLESLLGEANRIVYMGILSGHDILYIEALYPPRRRINYSAQGRRAPLYCTAIGKAALAFMPEEFIDTYVQAVRLEPLTPSTITDVSTFLAELDLTRERGYAIDRQEREVGIQCVGVPVRAADGRLIAAISISGSVADIPLAKMQEIGQEAVDAGRHIAQKIASSGYY